MFPLFILFFISEALTAPVAENNPPALADPSLEQQLISTGIHAQDVVKTGIEQQKLAADALISGGHLLTDLQKKTFLLLGAQAKDLTNAGIQQQHLIADVLNREAQAATDVEQKLLGSTILHGQQILSTGVNAQKLFVDSISNQFVNAIELEKKITETGFQIPYLFLNGIKYPYNLLKSYISPNPQPGAVEQTSASQPPIISYINGLSTLANAMSPWLSYFSNSG